MMSKFWWGQKEKERKLAWVSWEKLCTLKAQGGMELRDLKAFNLALLVKQGWRIQQNPSSLIHRVFKAKYFTGNPFKEVQLGSQPSYVWRSIMVAKDIIVKSSKWTIGNGKGVHIWENRWLPTPKSFKVVSPRGSHMEVEMVSSLINT